MTDRRIVGSIDVRQAGRLILSVPADEGWSLYVDGKKTKIKPFADALIGVHLKKERIRSSCVIPHRAYRSELSSA